MCHSRFSFLYTYKLVPIGVLVGSEGLYMYTTCTCMFICSCVHIDHCIINKALLCS